MKLTRLPVSVCLPHIRCWSMCNRHARSFQPCEQVARLAAEFNATYLVVGGGAVRSTGIREQDYQQLGQALEQVADMASRIGLIATYHPHLGTCVQAPDQLEKLFQYTSIGLCPDTAHVQAGGGDPTAILR